MLINRCPKILTFNCRQPHFWRANRTGIHWHQCVSKPFQLGPDRRLDANGGPTTCGGAVAVLPGISNLMSVKAADIASMSSSWGSENRSPRNDCRCIAMCTRVLLQQTVSYVPDVPARTSLGPSSPLPKLISDHHVPNHGPPFHGRHANSCSISLCDLLWNGCWQHVPRTADTVLFHILLPFIFPSIF